LLSNLGAAGYDRDEDVEDDEGEESEYTNLDPYQGHQADIHLCTPKGENVIWQDVKWERNPYADANQDSSELLVIVPGHHLLRANNTAVDLCASMQTDLCSQFCKRDPTPESKTLLYSLGRDRVIENQARSATRLQTLEEKQKEVNVIANPKGLTPTIRSIQSPKQGKNLEEDIGDKDETTNDPVEIPIEVLLRDTSLFYSNGQPKPSFTGQRPIAEPTNRRMIRQGKRGKGKGGGDFEGQPLIVSENRSSDMDGSTARVGSAKPTYPPLSPAIRALVMDQTLA